MKNNTITMYCFRMVAVVSMLLAINQLAGAQESTSKKEFWNDTLRRIALPSSSEQWIDLRSDAGINALNFFQQYGIALHLTANDEMRLYKTKKDFAGFTHYWFQQYYRNIKIAGAEYIIHVNAKGEAYAANGKYIRLMDKLVNRKLSETVALQQALKSVGAKKYLWQEKYWEDALKQRTNKPDTSYYPKGELVWVKAIRNENWNASGFRLAYQFDIFASSPRISKRIEVDAVTGEIINIIPLEYNCSPATVNTIWNGSRSISTQLYTASKYRLNDDCDTAGIWVRNWNSATDVGNPVEIASSNNVWITTNQVFGGSVLWALKNANNYFKNTFGRKGWDDNNSELMAYINAYFICGYDQNNNPMYCPDNASTNPSTGSVLVGAGSNGGLANSYGTLDIMGHEFTHLVAHANTGPFTGWETPVILESLGDIFGNVIQSVTLGAPNDYLVGEDRIDGAHRSMSNPNQYQHPDTHQGDFWEYGGDPTYRNCGVMNYWFYLLSNGGSGTNDRGDSYWVKAIDQFNAARILYKAFDYMTSSVDYYEMSLATVAAAKDIYGSCSIEVSQVKNAWYAVGITSSGAPNIEGGVCGNWPFGGVYHYAATGTVTSPPIQCFGGTTTVSGATFTSFTGSHLVFMPGFTAASGCNFLAYVTPCTEAAFIAESIPVGDGNTIRAVEKNALQKTDAESFGASVYPNPARSMATVLLRGAKGAVSVTLTNIQGNVLWRRDGLNAVSIPIPVSTLARGMYFINVKDGEHTKTLKLMKE